MKLTHYYYLKLKSESLMVFLLMIAGGIEGQGRGSGTCGTSFFSALIQMIHCRPAVAPFSPIPPSKACCNAVRTLGQPCLRVRVNGPPISGVDRNMAMLLPEKCTTNFDPCTTTTTTNTTIFNSLHLWSVVFVAYHILSLVIIWVSVDAGDMDK